MTRNLYELKKSHWKVLSSNGDKELIVSKNGNHAIFKDGDTYLEWDFDLKPGETIKDLLKRNRNAEWAEWLKQIPMEVANG